MENAADSQKAMESGSIHINVERMKLVGGTGGLGGQATHGGIGGTGGLGEGARIVSRAQNVTINNNSDSNNILDTVVEKQLEEWLNAPDPKEKQTRSSGLKNRSPCSWLFEDSRFISWRNNAGELLWIEGASGTGKTIISSMIIELLFTDRASPNNMDSTIAYFYFDFTDLGKQSVENALRRLVLQLSRQSPAPYVTLHQEYKLCAGQTVPTYSRLLEILKKLLRTLGHTYLILDALDECKTEDHDFLVDFIQKISTWSDIQLHVLVTSQARAVFAKTFLSLKTLSRIAIQADMTSDDIRLYISNELASKSELQLWKPEWDHITTYITQKSAGMFRLAYCLLEQLKDCVRLDDLQEALDVLPDNLHDIYARSLRSIPKQHLLDVQRLLQWLAFSQQALTLAQLEDTIAFDFSDSECYTFDPRRRPKRGIFIKWLSVLVSIEPVWQERILDSDGFYRGDCTVSLAHSSVQDYLLLEQEKHPTSCNSCPVHVTKGAAHRFMAQTCVCYLLHFADHPLNAETFPNYPLAMYAAKNWCYHLLRCADQATLSTLTMRLLEVGSGQYTALNQLSSDAYLDRPNTVDAPLYLCAVLGYIEGVKFLLDAGADANAVGRRFSNFNIPHGTALQAASVQGHLAIVRLLLEKGADVNIEGANGTVLHLASRNGRLEIVHLLLENGADIKAIHHKKFTALHEASWNGNLDVVRLLLENGADINVNNGCTALELASEDGNVEVVCLLLEKGADVNAQGDLTALQAASKAGHPAIVHFLLEKAADVNSTGRYGTALQLASRKGRIEIVHLLLERGADIDATSETRMYTALQFASSQGHIELVQLLLKKGADVNIGHGGTALQLALSAGHIAIVHLLLEKGANINARGGKGMDPPLLIALEEGHMEIAKLLLENGADANTKGGTALQVASKTGHIELVHLLLEKGADVNAKGIYGTALQLASRDGHIEVVRLLLKEGAKVNAMNERNNGALELASYYGHIDIVHLLLEEGAKVNAMNKRNYSALQLASLKGHLHCVRLLLESGADINANNGDTPLQFASRKGHIEIVKLLLEWSGHQRAGRRGRDYVGTCIGRRSHQDYGPPPQAWRG